MYRISNWMQFCVEFSPDLGGYGFNPYPLAGTNKIMRSFETTPLKMLENVGFLFDVQNKRVLTKLVGCFNGRVFRLLKYLKAFYVKSCFRTTPRNAVILPCTAF